MNAYALTFAVIMLTGGKLADFFGRRRVFLIGLAIFTISSLACGLASGGGDADRRAHGPGRRRRADAARDALDHLGDLSAAPARDGHRDLGGRLRDRPWRSARSIGGLITEHINWSWIFFVNVPIGVLGA